MDRIPFGVRQLDTIINGGAPRGSVVLLSGEAGAGSREFMHTSAVMNGLATGDPELYDLHYGDLAADAVQPDEVHYLSFTADEAALRREMLMEMDDDIVDAGLDSVHFHDMSERYFHPTPVPRNWYSEATRTIQDLRNDGERKDFLTALGETLSAIAPGNLLIIDSLTDLVSAAGETLEWADIFVLMKGLQKASYEWDGLVLLPINHDTLTAQRLGQLSDAATGTMRFSWESGGSTRARTLVVKQFRGVLSQIEAENIVRFETELGDAGFDISDVRKIR